MVVSELVMLSFVQELTPCKNIERNKQLSSRSVSQDLKSSAHRRQGSPEIRTYLGHGTSGQGPEEGR